MSRHGPPRQVLEAWQAGHIEVLTSSGIIEEVAAKLLDPTIGGRLRVTADDVQVVVQLLRTQARLITLTSTPAVTGDPEDDHVLSATLVGRADYLVTGDKKLLLLAQHGSATIINPRDFLAVISPASS